MGRLQWRGAFMLAAGFALAVGACKEERVSLSVDLRTDFVPGSEFTQVVTNLVPDGSDQRTSSSEVGATASDFITGTRVADFSDLPPGGFSVQVRVMSPAGELLVQRLARLSVSKDYALTMVVTRSCEGVECPLPEGDPGLTTCLGGQCVQPTCVPEEPSSCPAAECTVDADCKADAACVAAYCRAGTCLFVPDDGQCKPGQSCDVTRGCYTVGEESCTPTGATESDCSGGVDEDCDGKVDCADPDCAARACDDSNACTENDTCKGDACVGGEARGCDDDNACTDDACNPKDGCQHTPRTSGACDDGNTCTKDDRCDAGTCVGGGATDCDDKNPCTDDLCDAKDGCTHIDNTAPCDDGNACTEGDRCAAGACKAGTPRLCNDKNPCTDDACLPASGCTAYKNKASCDDGVFCNGADSCQDGACSQHAGNPCAQQCDDATQQCVGCLADADCGPPSEGAWSECGGFVDACGTSGTQERTITTPRCIDKVCTSSTATETQACQRITDGAACGDVVYGAWSDCDYADVCDNSATRSRTVTTPTCASGTCGSVVTQQSEACTRNTDGGTCKASAVGAWSACGGFASACDTTGSQTRTITDYKCAAGACKATSSTGSQSCTRTVNNGTSCGSGKYCCSGSCYNKSDPKHCSSCGISCASGQSCVGIGSGNYTCSCANSNAQCVNSGFGAGATCWDAGIGKGPLCNCQCTGNNCCAGGADCYKPSGQNYCSY